MIITDEYAKNKPLITKTSDDKMNAAVVYDPRPDGEKNNDIVYHFDLAGNKPKPAIQEDGSVNYRDLGLLRLCKAGDVLASVKNAEIKKNGREVDGSLIIPEIKKHDLSLLQGVNTLISEDGTGLTAAIDGLVTMNAGKVSVSGSIVIDGDINNATGDIVFPGLIHIKGNIRNGYTVKAGAGIRVGGVVEAAVLETDGDIILENGVRGGNKAVITAGGCIWANFLESCTVNAGGDISADSILHSVVLCGGSLTLKGKYGVMVGGKAVVKQCISAESIGSAVSTPTELYVGYGPETMKNYQELLGEYTETLKKYKELNLTVHSLTLRHVLKESKKRYLIKQLHNKFILRERLKDLRKRFDDILPEMESHTGMIKVSKKVHFGVKALIGNAIMYFRDDLANCVLTNVNGKINIGVND